MNPTPPAWLSIDIVTAYLTAEGFHVGDRGALDAALHRPFSVPFGHPAYPSRWLKAAALLQSIESSHPMMDGNKRTGVILCHALLRELGEEETPTSDDWFDLVVRVAGEHMHLEDIAAELARIYRR